MLEALEFGFMQRAVLAGLAIGIVCPTIGLFMILRRLSMIGDTLAHVTLAGVAAGLWMKVYPVATALLFSLGAGFGIEKLRSQYRQHSDLAIAITLSVSVGLAALFLSLANTPGVDLFAYLFGSIITVSYTDMLVITGLSAVVMATVGLIYKELFLVTFDEDLAESGGLPVRVLGVLFTVMTALTVAITMRVVGVLLVSSLMVLPAATSLQVSRRLGTALVLAIVFAEAAVLSGLFVAYHLDVVPGGTIVLMSAAMLLAVLLTKRMMKDRRLGTGTGPTAAQE